MAKRKTIAITINRKNPDKRHRQLIDLADKVRDQHGNTTNAILVMALSSPLAKRLLGDT